MINRKSLASIWLKNNVKKYAPVVREEKLDKQTHRKKKVDYKNYLVSKEWYAFRCKVMGDRGYKCEKCGTSNQLTVHHKHYKSLGHEQLKDVELLCWNCHQAQHPWKERPVKSYFDRNLKNKKKHL